MNNDEIVACVNAWQNNPHVHPLTCGNDSNHTALVPEIRDNNVILKCVDCSFEQLWIPDCIKQEFDFDLFWKQFEFDE